MARNDPQVNIRFPAELKARLEKVAAESGRSVTAEVIDRLYRSFPSVEAVILQNRAAEASMLRETSDSLVAEVKRLTADLQVPGIAVAERERLEAEKDEALAEIKWLAGLMDQLLTDVELVRSRAVDP